jgi:hypothetical protein
MTIIIMVAIVIGALALGRFGNANEPEPVRIRVDDRDK